MPPDDDLVVFIQQIRLTGDGARIVARRRPGFTRGHHANANTSEVQLTGAPVCLEAQNRRLTIFAEDRKLGVAARPWCISPLVKKVSPMIEKLPVITSKITGVRGTFRPNDRQPQQARHHWKRVNAPSAMAGLQSGFDNPFLHTVSGNQQKRPGNTDTCYRELYPHQ